MATQAAPSLGIVKTSSSPPATAGLVERQSRGRAKERPARSSPVSWPLASKTDCGVWRLLSASGLWPQRAALQALDGSAASGWQCRWHCSKRWCGCVSRTPWASEEPPESTSSSSSSARESASWWADGPPVTVQRHRRVLLSWHGRACSPGCSVLSSVDHETPQRMKCPGWRTAALLGGCSGRAQALTRRLHHPSFGYFLKS